MSEEVGSRTEDPWSICAYGMNFMQLINILATNWNRLAGGKWEIIEPMIIKHLCNEGIEVHVYLKE